MPKTLILIPSRMSATRLPGKPLLKINNLSIISHVVNKAKKAEIGRVVVCTEDKLILEDVITTGKSSMECVKLIKNSKAKLVGFASIIDRSTKKSLKIKKKIVSYLKIDVPTYKFNQLPDNLKSIPISIPGSRFIK